MAGCKRPRRVAQQVARKTTKRVAQTVVPHTNAAARTVKQRPLWKMSLRSNCAEQRKIA
jgi:hypothetical protein